MGEFCAERFGVVMERKDGSIHTWFEEECFQRAKGGNVEAGIEALQICIAGIANKTLSPSATLYLVQCLEAVIGATNDSGVSEALHIKRRKRGRPPVNDYPSFALGLVAALLHKRGLKPSQIVGEICALYDRDNKTILDQRMAWKIYSEYEPMRDWDEALLQECLKRTGKYSSIFSQ